MTTLILLALALSLLAAAVLVRAMRRARGGDVDRSGLNVALFRERREELARELALGRIDDAQHAALLAELQVLLVNDVTADSAAPGGAGAGAQRAWLLFPLVPVLAGALWLATGLDADSRAWLALLGRADEAAGGTAALVAAGMDPVDAGRLVQATLPHDAAAADRWMMLGMHWLDADAAGLALEAFRTAHRHAPDRHEIGVALARLELAVSGGQLTDEVRGLLDAALAANPQDDSVHLLYGMAAFQSGKPQEALAHWEQVLAHVDPASDGARMLRDVVAKARAQASQPPSPGLPVAVRLAPGLAVPDGAVLFVVARAKDGPPMPLAAKRLPPVLPVDTRLTEADAVMGGQGLAAAGTLRVRARLSLGGNPMPSPGDLQSAEVEVAPPFGQPVTLLIDQRVP